VPGYDVLPGPKPIDRYYDDNAWMVLQLLESYEVLQDKQILSWARETLRYVLSGEDHRLGGGIYWRETERNGKNTCSNGPSAAACLAVYRYTKEPRLLSKAIQLYGWTKRNLQDPSDGLFWDGLSLNGTVNRTKWSYNTALMIRTAADLLAVTGNPEYRRDLDRMVAASRERWLGEGIRDEGKFAHLLLDSWIFASEVAGIDLLPEQTTGAIDAVWERSRNEAGFFGKRFDGPAPAVSKRHELIDQASASRAFLSLARHLKGKGERTSGEFARQSGSPQ
jgi:hypothetical protein